MTKRNFLAEIEFKVKPHNAGWLPDSTSDAALLLEMRLQSTPDMKVSATVYERLEDMVADNAKKQKPGFLVVQEGGSSTELYAHGFEKLKQAEKYRKSCKKDGSYRTSVPVEIPAHLANDPQFFAVVEEILKASLELDYPE